MIPGQSCRFGGALRRFAHWYSAALRASAVDPDAPSKNLLLSGTRCRVRAWGTATLTSTQISTECAQKHLPPVAHTTVPPGIEVNE